ncbi:hypothetical protein KGF54_004099 [Candida jiufengensis]|uniref:uncharacterized protein n=1 Tax=Candida jiufengensis TaxID=497108 RepID=UPI002224070B|nr:uncharacterized protein KGF54_004099 [Candida jiufengensis]KAI5951025.1 hypothetical protein KGF54_004099 [Candida jiufengensis]
MSITKDSIPEELKSDKNITPYIQRAIELEEAEPIISYYSKIYVLEHIFNNKLHTKSKPNQEFTVKLLDDTESIKNKSEDENLKQVLNDKDLSFGYIFKFAYKLFNSCLEILNNYQLSFKNQIIGKFRATMCFLNILSIFESSKDEIDFTKFTGGKVNNWKEIDELNKEKLKILKYQLTRIIKDEIDVGKAEEITDKDLEDELNRELDQLNTNNEEEIEQDQELKDLGESKAAQEDGEEPAFKLPGAPRDLPDNEESTDDNSQEISHIDLPGAPHFSPDKDSNLGLPETPQYLPDDDITNINKSGSIHVFTPTSEKSQPKFPTDKKPIVSRSTSHQSQQHHKPLSKESIKQILNRDDAITQIQKHTKFASSALQFDDFNEAEKQLLQGLELLRTLKQQEESE